MVGRLRRAQHHVCDVGQVRAPRLLVDGADVHLGLRGGGVLGVDVDDGDGLEQDLVLGLDQLAAPPVPAGPLQVQAVDVDALGRGLTDVVLHVLGHVVLQDHVVQGPALVGASHLLEGGQVKAISVSYLLEGGQVKAISVSYLLDEGGQVKAISVSYLLDEGASQGNECELPPG